MAANLDTIVEQLSTLSVLEAAELVKKLEEKWGVSAAAPVAMAAMPGAAAAAEPVEEKTEFDVVIKDPGAKKALTVDEDGRIRGHAWEWDTCHIGIPGVCTQKISPSPWLTMAKPARQSQTGRTLGSSQRPLGADSAPE
jgi:hypothetical protein